MVKTLDNFRTVLSGEVTTTGGTLEAPYLRWFANSLGVALITAFVTVLSVLGSLACSSLVAYAIARNWNHRFFRGSFVYLLSALLAGVGIGLFIDEVGKFITAENDYFYPAAAPIIVADHVDAVLAVGDVLDGDVPPSESLAELDRLADALGAAYVRFSR